MAAIRRIPIYAFSGSDGLNPDNGVIFDNAGNLYGTTYAGGLGSVGTVFELMYPGWTQSCTLNNFRGGNDGGCPIAGLIFDKPGTNLYGATSTGGANGGGTVFELTPLDKLHLDPEHHLQFYRKRRP